MAEIRRLTDSCLLVSTETGTTMLDPGFWTFDSGAVDLDTIGEVQRILITHEHIDHVKPEFVAWVLDRGSDVSVHGNEAVAELLEPHGIEVDVAAPPGVTAQDVIHEMTPMGTAPPNRAWTIEGVMTHPGDSYQPTVTAPVLALPLLVLWGSTTQSMEFARRLGPRQVVPIHDFYTSSEGRRLLAGIAARALERDGIEVVPLDWGDSYTV